MRICSYDFECTFQGMVLHVLMVSLNGLQTFKDLSHDSINGDNSGFSQCTFVPETGVIEKINHYLSTHVVR